MMFKGFPPDGVRFLQELKENNSKEWFAQNKRRYKEGLEGPGREFVATMEESLGEPWQGKVFRFYRDLRFSKDKTPYNTHLRISFTAPGEAGLFFSLEPDKLVLGAGLFEFPKQHLERYRQDIDSARGGALEKVLVKAQESGFRCEEPELKRVPRGWGQDHPRADLLRRKGLCLWRDAEHPDALYSKGLIPHCMGCYEELRSLRSWLKELL